MAKIVVKQVHSIITETPNTRRVIASLGLGRIGKVKVHKDNNCIRGMINKVRHLVTYELKND